MSDRAELRAGTPASEPEVCPIEVRDADGRLIRKVTQRQAESAVEKEVGYWRGSREVRLHAVHSGNPRTWLGRRQDQHRGVSHNHRVCEEWPHMRKQQS
jgi:hypothetical protein